LINCLTNKTRSSLRPRKLYWCSKSALRATRHRKRF